MATRLKRLGLQHRVGENAHERLRYTPSPPSPHTHNHLKMNLNDTTGRSYWLWVLAPPATKWAPAPHSPFVRPFLCFPFSTEDPGRY